MIVVSPRDTVNKAIEFGDPDWTPYYLAIPLAQLAASCQPAALDAVVAELHELGAIERTGHLMAQDILVNVGPAPTQIPEPYQPLGAGEWVDEWGTIWTSREFPRVNGHPLEADWSLLGGYRLPDPCAPGRYDEAAAL